MAKFIQSAVSAVLIVIIVVMMIQGLTNTEKTKTVIFQHNNPEYISNFVAEFCNDPDVLLLAQPEVTKEAGVTFVTIRYQEKK